MCNFLFFCICSQWGGCSGAQASLIENRTKKCGGINPNRLSANQVTGFSKSVKMNLIGLCGSRHERLGSEYHSDHHSGADPGGGSRGSRPPLFTPHAQRERGKVIDRGVHIYICL